MEDLNKYIGVGFLLDKDHPRLRFTTYNGDKPVMKVVLEERVSKIIDNVKKLGTLDMLENYSEGSKKYVKTTITLIRYYLLVRACEEQYMTEDDLRKLSSDIAGIKNDTIRKELLKGFDAIEKMADELLDCFTSYLGGKVDE